MSSKTFLFLTYLFLGSAASVTITSLSAAGKLGNRYLKQCWYDGDYQSFKSELEETAEKLKKLEKNNEELFKKLKDFIEEKAEDNLYSYCWKSYYSLVEKLDEIFERFYEYYEDEKDYEKGLEINDQIFNSLTQRWNEYNELNYKTIWKWGDNEKAISEDIKKKY